MSYHEALHRISKGLSLGVVCAAFVLFGCGSDDEEVVVAAPTNGFGIAKASCGANDSPETGLQGQVAAPLRVPGAFKGFNCNLQLVAQSRNDGGSWQHDWFAD